jgi:hypothetical protein
MAAPPAPEPEASPDSIEIVYVPRDGARPHRHHAVQVVVRAFREFAATPMLVMFGFAVLAGVSIAGDQAHLAGLDAVRRALSHVIGKQASTTTLQAIATGLITVTSITFSVLLLAVQQTASTLSPVVFDQFVRRRTNQVFLGFFVGLALYAYVVMAVVQDKTPPIIGAFIATVLTVISMLLLLALVYTSIDQMRPTNVVRQIRPDPGCSAPRGADGVSDPAPMRFHRASARHVPLVGERLRHRRRRPRPVAVGEGLRGGRGASRRHAWPVRVLRGRSRGSGGAAEGRRPGGRGGSAHRDRHQPSAQPRSRRDHGHRPAREHRVDVRILLEAQPGDLA